MAWPASGPGRLLERYGDVAPRGMTVHDKTRLIGRLRRFHRLPGDESPKVLRSKTLGPGPLAFQIPAPVGAPPLLKGAGSFGWMALLASPRFPSDGWLCSLRLAFLRMDGFARFASLSFGWMALLASPRFPSDGWLCSLLLAFSRWTALFASPARKIRLALALASALASALAVAALSLLQLLHSLLPRAGEGARRADGGAFALMQLLSASRQQPCPPCSLQHAAARGLQVRRAPPAFPR